MNWSSEFSGKVAVVTGGSDGLGLDFCSELARAGAQVHFCARRSEMGLAAEKRIGPNACYFQADLAAPD